MDIKELNDIIKRHNHWLKADCDGWKKMRANLSGADLSGADLSGANLSGADLSGADLSGADLSRANLPGANLSGANLSGANLFRADLSGAYLSGADLFRANLSGADLSGANLPGANLSGADLSGANNIPYIPISCPDSGSFIGWKKVSCKTEIGFCDGLAKLFIPADAKRSSATTRKCRCDKATVLSLEIINGDPRLEIDCACSSYDPNFIYRVGDHIEIPNFDDDRFHECAPGIHFFINKQEAIDY